MNSGAGFRRFRRSSPPAATDRRGWALVTVLWVVAILSMLAAAIQALTVTSAKTEHRAQDIARAGSDLDAGVARAAVAIVDPDASKRWRVDGVPADFTFDGLRIRVWVQDQLGCIDLNAADVTMLRQLLETAGKLQASDADSMADKILDWRSTDDLHSLHGATDADYAAAHYLYRQRHGPFQTVDELKLVMGMTPQLFARIRPALTVYNHHPAFDSNFAPREALEAMYPGNEAQVDTILTSRESGSGLQGSAATPGTLSPAASPAGRAFAVDEVLVLNGRRFMRQAVIEMTGDDKRPYFVLAWK